MLLAYVDESYNDNFYYMAALLCPDEHAQDLASALDAVVIKAMRDHKNVRADTELHGYELFQGVGGWRSLRKLPRARISIYHQTLAAIGALPVQVIVRGVDRRRLAERCPGLVNPHSIVLSHLLERIDEHAKKLGHRALVIADEIPATEQWQCRDDRGHRLTQIVDTLHFAPSNASRLVQAADMVVFLARRILGKEDTDPRAITANEELWGCVEPRVVHCWCWQP